MSAVLCQSPKFKYVLFFGSYLYFNPNPLLNFFLSTFLLTHESETNDDYRDFSAEQ